MKHMESMIYNIGEFMKQLFETYRPEELVQSQRVLNTPSDFAKRALFYVQEAGYLKSLRTHQSQRSSLNSYLFLLVLSGKGTFTYQDEIYQLQANDCVYINCMNAYTHQSDTSYPWELLWVHFNGISALEYYHYYSKIFSNVFHANNHEVYSALLNQLIDVTQKKEASWELLSSKLLTDILTNCIVIKNTDSPQEGESIIHKLYEVKDYLEKNYQQKLLLEDIASSFYISKYHLCREYKKLFGITIIDHITMRRITAAKELLRFTKKSISDIAIEIGYPDASYFNKVFQKIESMTASEYRKKW